MIDRETIRMRVWERGGMVTLACGSGACAAAVVTARRGLTGRRVTVRLDGGELGIDWRDDGVWMTGPTALVFEGRLAADFLGAVGVTAPVFATLGCRLNAYETEAMKGLAEAAGVRDAVVVNSCAVTAEAVRQARQQIRRLRRDNPGARVVVTGCAAQTDPAGFAAMPEVDLVLGNAEKLRPEAWARLADGRAERVAVGDIMAERRPAAPLIDGLGTRARAYVQVQNGCDHRCTFCIIPYGRGNSRSVPAATVVAQVARLRDRGFNEVVLTGVDLTSWGADLDGAPRLGDLVAAVLAGVPDLPRLRLSSIDSVEADPRLVEAIGGEPRLMPHLHLSLQAGDDLILKRMKRRHLRDDAIGFCETVRRARPGGRVRRRPDRRLPDRDRGDVREHAAPRRGLRPDLAARLPLQRPGRHAGGADAAGRRRRRSASGPRGCARSARDGSRRTSRPRRGREVSLLMERPDLGRTEGFALARLRRGGGAGQPRPRPGDRARRRDAG